jgi:DNA-binding PadR family transcriptional regulator
MDPLIIAALREAIRQEHASPVVGGGKGRTAKGLFPKRTKPYGEAIKVCLDKEHGFLDIIREEQKGKTIQQFVRINDRGLETLVANLPVEEFGKLIAEAHSSYRGKLLEQCLRSVRERLSQFQEQKTRLMEARQRMAIASLEFMHAYMGRLDEDKSHLDSELAGALEARNRLAQERAAHQTAIARKEDGQSTRSPLPAVSESDLDFQRDISEELVYAWQDTVNPETQDALARVLFNVGVERIAKVGERVEFDGRWHHTDEALHPGDPAEVVHPGWRLVNQRGSYLIARARVKAASKTGETRHVQHD